MKRIHILSTILIPLLCAHGINLTNRSGSICFHLKTTQAGQLVYSVDYHNTAHLLEAPLGIVVDGDNLGERVRIGPVTVKPIHEVFPWLGGKNMATNSCLAYTVQLLTDRGSTWTLEVRLFEDGLAFRYIVPSTGRRRINGETTGWQLPADVTVWFQTNINNYEGVYRRAPAEELPVGTNDRPVYIGPPLTVSYGSGSFALISEAALRRYSGLSFRHIGGGRLIAAFPHNRKGWDHIGEVVSPWRVVILTDSLNALVNSDVIPALCEPPDPELFPKGVLTDWIRPGQGFCTWMVFGNSGARWELQKWWVDMSAAMGCEYLLVDAGWRSKKWGWTKDGTDLWQRLKELCQYAAERNVGILLWHAFPEGRDDGPGLTDPQAREELFRRCSQAGVKGIKVDFFDSESVETIEVLEQLRRLAAQYKLLIIFHGVNKPTGESRTWPHEITREGVREQEYQLWSSLPLEHYGALPFTRCVVGAADFLPGFIQKRFLKETSAAFQIASVVVFSSPVMFWPDHPEAYLSSPAYPFFRYVPSTWDETRVLPGSSIGELVLMARRKGMEWYIAALNCQHQAKEITLTLTPFLKPDQWFTVYRDHPSRCALEVETGPSSLLPAEWNVKLVNGGGIFTAPVPAPSAGELVSDGSNNISARWFPYGIPR